MNPCTTQSSAFCFVPLGIRYHLQHHIVDLLAAPWVLRASILVPSVVTCCTVQYSQCFRHDFIRRKKNLPVTSRCTVAPCLLESTDYGRVLQ
jgi:hypothetical protein